MQQKLYYGCSTRLDMRQLHQVYRALRIADPEEVSVSDVLIRYGVWNFSRCALRYRQIYGELPSQTLHTFFTSRSKG